MNNEKVTVTFTETGAEIETTKIEPSEIENGGHYLVDKDHNADVILKPVNEDQSIPEGPWKMKKGE